MNSNYSNMEMRAILQMNTDEIVRNNQAIAYGKCSNVVPVNDTRVFGPPKLFSNVLDNYLTWDNPSDLKDQYLNKYKNSLVRCVKPIFYTQQN